MADVDERAQFFINAGQTEDNDELMDELNELEAEMAEEDLQKMDLDIAGPIKGFEQGAKQPVKQPAAA